MMGRTSAEKVASKMAQTVSKYEKRENRASCSFNLEKKAIDGITVTVGSICDYGGMEVCCGEDDKPMPLKEEYTDLNEFKMVIASVIDAKAKAIS